MDEKIEQYLEDINELVDVDTYNNMVEDAEKLDTKTWLNKYQDFAQNDDTLAATWREYGFDKYSKDKYERYRDAFGSDDKKNPYNKSEKWLKAVWQTDFEDVPYETFKTDIANMSKFWEDEKRAREYEAGKTKRAKEIKNWHPLKDLLASDYSKQRYINEPDASLFGNEGKFNPYSSQGQEELADVLFGVAGLGGDLLPGGRAFIGPGVRAVRDVKHKLEDSPYQKDWQQIGKDALADAATTLFAWRLANAKRADRVAEGLTDDVIKDAINVDKETKEITESIKQVDAALLTPGFTDSDLNTLINALPDTEYKSALMAEAKGWTNKPINRKNIFDITTTYATQTDPEVREVYKLRADANKPPLDIFESTVQVLDDEGKEAIAPIRKLVTEPTEYVNKRISTPTYDELSKMQKAKYNLKNLMTDVNKGNIGQIGTQVSKTAALNPDVNTKEELAKDWYKQNYARDWELGFKPTEKEGDPKWEAYKEWLKENEGK